MAKTENDDCDVDLTNCGPGPGKRGPTDPVDDSAPDMQRMVKQIEERCGKAEDGMSGMKTTGNFKQPWER